MASSGDRVRVLVVDDAAFMRKQLRDILEVGGHAVVAEGADGDEALRLYETHRPDVVTLDLVMPRRGGIDTLKELRARHPDARVVVCSSVSDEPTILEAIAMGARDYVLKPVSPGKVLDAVQKAAAGRG